MDQKLKMLLMMLSDKYDISVTNYSLYNRDTQKFNNKFKVTIKYIKTGNVVDVIECYSKSNLVLELMKWVE